MPSPVLILEEEDTMRELLIVFQDGFDEANITVMVNGKEVRRDIGVSTNPLIGEVPLPARGVLAIGQAAWEIRDPDEYSRLVSASITCSRFHAR